MQLVKFSIALAVITIDYTIASRDPHYVPEQSAVFHLFQCKWNNIVLEFERFFGFNEYASDQVGPTMRPKNHLVFIITSNF